MMKMTVAQLTVKEDLCRCILNLPAETAEWFSQCLGDFEAHEPNEETVKAIEESMNPENLLGPYNSVEEMFEDFGIHVDAQYIKNLQA
jgi:hypothetical protein